MNSSAFTDTVQSSMEAANAWRQARRTAGAQRTLDAVACTPQLAASTVQTGYTGDS